MDRGQVLPAVPGRWDHRWSSENPWYAGQWGDSKLLWVEVPKEKGRKEQRAPSDTGTSSSALPSHFYKGDFHKILIFLNLIAGFLLLLIYLLFLALPMLTRIKNYQNC